MKRRKVEEQGKFKKIISIILLIIWCLLIFYFSSQEADLSNISSSKIINIINKILNVNLYDFKYSILIVRKIAHMFLYFILYILSLNVFKKYKCKYFLVAFLFCLFYATMDEFHQLFVVGRTCKVVDILIDMCGSFLGLFLTKIINKLKFI